MYGAGQDFKTSNKMMNLKPTQAFKVYYYFVIDSQFTNGKGYGEH